MNFTFTVFFEQPNDGERCPQADSEGSALARLLFGARSSATEIAPCVLGTCGDLAFGGTLCPAAERRGKPQTATAVSAELKAAPQRHARLVVEQD